MSNKQWDQYENRKDKKENGREKEKGEEGGGELLWVNNITRPWFLDLVTVIKSEWVIK